MLCCRDFDHLITEQSSQIQLKFNNQNTLYKNSQSVDTKSFHTGRKQQSIYIWHDKGRICSNSEIDTLISKRLAVENKVKLSQLTRKEDLVKIEKLPHKFQSDYL